MSADCIIPHVCGNVTETLCKGKKKDGISCIEHPVVGTLLPVPGSTV